MQVSYAKIRRVQQTIWRWYRKNRRDLPWRPALAPFGKHLTGGNRVGPYEMLVSELMLQQTQVERVIPYYERFLTRFPTVESLAAAELREVLTLWSGLGYNRRARYLWECAKLQVTPLRPKDFEGQAGYKGEWPRTVEELQKLPGVGPAVAGMLASALGQRVPVVGETNVRQVIHHFFFPGEPLQEEKVYTEIAWALLPKRTSAREWNYAMFDYGALVVRPRRSIPKPANQLTIKPANQFLGSNRYWRGEIMRRLVAHKQALSLTEFQDIPELEMRLQGLIRDQLILQQGRQVRIR